MRYIFDSGRDEIFVSRVIRDIVTVFANYSGFSHVQQVLLCKATSRIVNEINYMGNTPLHMAAAVSNSVTLERQKEVCRFLIQAGGQTNVQNRQGKTPLALVSPERKDAIKKIFYKKLWWWLIDFNRSRTLYKTDLCKCSKEQAFKLHEDFPFRLDSRHVHHEKLSFIWGLPFQDCEMGDLKWRKRVPIWNAHTLLIIRNCYSPSIRVANLIRSNL